MAGEPGSTVRAGIEPAAYRDSTAEDAAAPDITRVTVSGRAVGLTVFRIQVANRLRLTSDLGLEIIVDADHADATGDRTLRFGLGAEYLITVFSGKPRLLQWSSLGKWRPLAPPSFSYARGAASIVVRARALGGPSGFAFGVSVGSGIVAQPGGTLDITNAHFDFAPDVSHTAWTYEIR